MGACVPAKDRVGIWRSAKVVGERDEGDGREVLVHFDRWNTVRQELGCFTRSEWSSDVKHGQVPTG